MQKVIRRWIGAVLLGALGLVGWAAVVGSTPQAAEETKTKLNAPTSETGASPIEKKLEELSEMFKMLGKDVSTLSSRVNAHESVIRKQEEYLSLLLKLSKDLSDLVSSLKGLEAHTLNSIDPQLNQIRTTLKIVADEVSPPQPVPHVVTFRGMVQSDLQEIKQQLQKMTERLGVVSGRLVVENYTGVRQTLRLNGKDYLVPAGQMIIHHVPVQEVEVYLPYHEPPKRYPREVWRQVGPNEYEFTLHIWPKQPIVVLSQQ